ncbi:cuticle protein 19-like, partial [Penaeus monodon]|uniref:cuticle protein 19-like n=1 Tax=Penaeus monodon TaxID=6687 RepID=UPI0018A7430C
SRPQYNFNYAVNDAFGNDFGHQEGRDGYNTQGAYYVQLPDGRLQRVTYTVNGDQGYVAQVTYEGVAQYPAFQPSTFYSPAPSYG